jgi:hypothetical protein
MQFARICSRVVSLLKPHYSGGGAALFRCWSRVVPEVESRGSGAATLNRIMASKVVANDNRWPSYHANQLSKSLFSGSPHPFELHLSNFVKLGWLQAVQVSYN